MRTTLSKEAITQELLAIVKENTVSSLPVTYIEMKRNHPDTFLHFKFADEYSYILCNETFFFSAEDREHEDDIFIIDSGWKEAFVDFEKHFNITGKETILQLMSRAYDEVHAIYTFAYGNKHTGVKRPETIDDILFYAQYDGNNYCFLLDAYIDDLGHNYEIRLYPVVNLQKRTIEIDYRIVSGYVEYNDYEESIADLFESVIFSKIGKKKEDLTPEDSTVLQMLNV